MYSTKRRIDALACALVYGGLIPCWAPLAAGQDSRGNLDATGERIRVFVTGSNIPTVDRETAVPVQIITREDIQRANFQTAAQLANSISATVSYFTLSENQAIAGSLMPGLAAAGLRGLTAQRTLVLVNGRRIANYALGGTLTDLNLIPVTAIERVEVLKDGASAIYGSDAIGGVINFILLQEFHGLQASAQYSSPEQTGGWSKNFNVTAGYGNLAEQKFSVYAMIDYQQYGAVAARDRSATGSNYIPGALDRTSPNAFPANVLIPSIGLRNPTGDPANAYANPSCAPPMSFPTMSSPNRCNFDPAYYLNIVNASERLAVTSALTWQFAPDHEFFFQGMYARNSFTFVAAPTPFQNNPATPLRNFTLPATSPWYPHAFASSFGVDGTPLDVSWRSVELGGRTDEPVLDQWNTVAGLKGTLAGWRYDTAFSYGVNSVDDRYTSGYVLGSAIFPLLNSGRVNPFDYNTPGVVSELASTQVDGTVRTGRSTQLMLDFRAWNAIYELPGGPVSVAVGAEARQWRQTQTSSAALASGDIVSVGNLPSMSASRDIWALFAEANVPLAKDLEANLALRFDHYSDTGSTTNPKVSVRWQPVPTLLFRGSVGTGFRAPSLEALYSPPIFGTTVPSSDPARCPTTKSPTDCGAGFPFQRGGNPALESETSSQWGVGAVWSPMRSLTLGVDYFDVVVHNLINGIFPDAVLPNCPNGVQGPTCQFIVRKPPDLAYPDLPGAIEVIRVPLFNSGTIRTTGVDLFAQYELPRYDWGQLKISAQGTYIIKYLQQQLDGSYVDQVNHELLLGFGGAIPYWHHYLTLDWNYGPWTATLTENFLRGTYDYLPNPGESQKRKVGDYDIWNIAASYGGFKGWQFSAGIKNLFDRDPPFSNQVFTGEGPVGYDPTYANPIGRVFWAAIAYSFR